MRIQRREEREKRTKLDPARDQSPVATINRNTQPISWVNSMLAGPAPGFPITVTLPVGIRGRKIRLLHRTNLRKFIVLPRENAFFPAALRLRAGGMLISTFPAA